MFDSLISKVTNKSKRREPVERPGSSNTLEGFSPPYRTAPYTGLCVR